MRPDARVEVVASERDLLLAAGAEELAQDVAALVGEHAGLDLDFVVHGAVVEDLDGGAGGAGAGIGCTKHQPFNPRMSNQPGAHGTGFKRDIQSRVNQTVIIYRLTGSANGLSFGMGGRVG